MATTEATEKRAAHTPRLWTAHGVQVEGPDGVHTQCGFGMRDDEEMQANAHLIAAAQKLLAASKLQAKADDLRFDGPSAAQSDEYLAVAVEARNLRIAAIAKATDSPSAPTA